ncbi:MAG: hypothetical protein OXI73_13015 [Rhodospirillales bacterium]|nr:hypothetical protein [Rhodospirillales bacterium]
MSAGVLRTFAQCVLYAGFALVVATFSYWPPYARIDPDSAVIKLSFSHAGDLREPCRTLGAEELAALAPNMRSGVDCPRERVPVVVELEIDGERVFHAALPPSGLAHDGPSSVYERFEVSAGPHRIRVRLRDTVRESGFDHEGTTDIHLSTRQSFVIDFRPELGGFQFL